jgi:hypothetical protein
MRALALPMQIENIFNPVRGPRDAQVRAGIKPVNHARNNVQSVREASQINALRKQCDAEERPGLKLPPGEEFCMGARRRGGEEGGGQKLQAAGGVRKGLSARSSPALALPLLAVGLSWRRRCGDGGMRTGADTRAPLVRALAAALSERSRRPLRASLQYVV